MPSYIPFDTLQEADSRSAEYWTAHLGREKRAEDITAYLYGRVVRTDESELPDGVDVAIVVPGRDRYLDGLIRADQLTADELAALVKLYPAWSGDGVDYEEHDIRAYDGTLWRCIKPHISQATWQPGVAHSLWVQATPEGVIPEWTQPQGSHDVYPLDMVVTHTGKLWKSLIADNAWEPGAVGSENLWQEIDADGNPVEPDNGGDEIEEWVAPTGAHDAYNTGDRVTRDGKIWESEIDNNVWEPGVHGWIEVSA